MELKIGECLLCHNVRVITYSQVTAAFGIIKALFSKKILNSFDFNTIKSSLELCPVCYHKLIILNHLKKNIEVGISKSDTKCFVCKCEETLFKITSWQYFNEVFEDLGFEPDSYLTCSGCLFYFHVRNELKAKLISKYHQVNSKIQKEHMIEQTIKYQNGTGRKAFNISPEETTSSKKKVNFSSLANLKPLKSSKCIKGLKIQQTDPKLFNQIPYVLLKVANISYGDTQIDNRIMFLKPSRKFCGVLTSKSKIMVPKSRENKIIPALDKSKSILKRDLNRQHKYVLTKAKTLFIRLSRMEMSEKWQQNWLGSLNDNSNVIKNTVKINNVNIQEQSSLEYPKVSLEKEICSKSKNSILFIDDENDTNYSHEPIIQNVSYDSSLKGLSENTITYKGNSEQCSKSLLEKNCSKTSDENACYKQSDTCISNKLKETEEKILSKDFVEGNKKKIDAKLTAKINNKFIEKPSTSDTRNESKNVLFFNTVEMRTENISFSIYNDNYLNLSDDGKDDRNNLSESNEEDKTKDANQFEFSTYKAKEDDKVLNSENVISNQKDLTDRFNINLDNKKEKSEIDSENKLPNPDSKMPSNTNCTQSTDLSSNQEKGYGTKNTFNTSFHSTENQAVISHNDCMNVQIDYSISKTSNVNNRENTETHRNTCKTDFVNVRYFSNTEKINDKEVTENDKTIIDTILSGLTFQQEQLESDTLDRNDHEGGNIETRETGGNYVSKRKISDEYCNSTDKKKKTVTFSEDVT